MNGKLQIIAAIINIDKPFRASHITQMTGLDRNLVRYHVVNFTSLNLLEKVDRTYILKNREGLLNLMIESAEKTETALPKPGGFFRTIDTLNLKAEAIVAARSLNLPMASDARDGYVKLIDDTIQVLKNLRKYVTNATKTEGSAQKFFKKNDDVEVLWEIFSSLTPFPCDLPEFEKAFNEAMVQE